MHDATRVGAGPSSTRPNLRPRAATNEFRICGDPTSTLNTYSIMINFEKTQLGELTTDAKASASNSMAPRDTLPSTVQNMTFMIEKLSEDCTPTQFLREYTQNGIDAIAKLPNGCGEITWDVDWLLFDATGQRKLACIDTGIGMSGPEMVRQLNQWFASGQFQSSTANFGVGAKISAMTRNRMGLTYQSWKDGQGAVVHLRYDPDARVYGLMRCENNGGEFWSPLSDDFKPKEIDSHGTKVVFHGNDFDEDTVEGPKGVTAAARWTARNLNTRYFRLPDGIKVRAREGWLYPRSDTRHNCLRQIEGQGNWLDRYAQSKGTIALDGATAHWWILVPDGHRGAGEVAAGGHTAALFQNELYELASGRAGIARLQAFGAIFGTERVVIYVEPHDRDGERPAANAARTQIKINGEGLNWTGWAAQFREKMPPELVSLQHEIGTRSGDRDYKESIASRLRQLLDLMANRLLCPNPNGALGTRPAPAEAEGEDTCEHIGGDSHRLPAPGPMPGRRSVSVGSYVKRLLLGGPKPGQAERALRTPQVHWISVQDGTRNECDMEDRAAKYLPEQELLLINKDFLVFASMLDRWKNTYQHVHGSEKAVQEVVQEWFEQQLLEVILGARALSAGGKWSSPELELLWSESALSAAVLPRWHVDSSIGRTLSHRFGSASKEV